MCMHAINQTATHFNQTQPHPDIKSTSNPSSSYPLIPLYFSYVYPTLSLLFPSFAPIHLVESHLAQPPATLCLLGYCICRLVAITAATGAALRRVLGSGGIDVFSINVLSFRHKRASAIASTRISLFETEELQFGVDEVDEMHGWR